MKPCLIAFLLLCSLTALSQKKTLTPQKRSQYRVNLVFTPQLYFNAINVKDDGVEPKGISTRNTGSLTTGIEFERKSKSGFLLNIGVLYSLQHHSIFMGYKNLDFFDPIIAEELNELGPQVEHYSGNTTYLKFRIMGGYSLPFSILHGCHIEVKAGLTAITGLSRFYSEYYRGIQFLKNDTLFVNKIGSGHLYLGSNDKFTDWWKTAECSVTLKKDINTKYLKNISVGIEFTRSLFFPWENKGWDGNINSYTLYGGNYPVSTDKYVSKNYSFGLRFCVGLWYK